MNEINTTDIGLAATIALNEPLVRITKEKDRGTFYFADNPNVRNVIDSYWKGECLVEPQMFFSKVKNLKSRISDAAKNTNI